jgi:hypothetical protein
MANLVDLYVVYRILRKLTTPFENWPAYKTGVIDAEGNILKSSSERNTQDERDSFNLLDVLILNLKKLLMKVPGGKTKFATYAAALFLIKEEKNLTPDNLEEKFAVFLSNKETLKEEIANVVGAGRIAGTTGDPPAGSKIMMRRFANNDVFVVDTKRYLKARLGKRKFLKYETYVGDDDVGEAIRQYGRKNPKKPIILQDGMTGAMIFLRHGKSGLFTESFGARLLIEEITQSDLKKIEQYADKLFQAVGIDVAFTRHFLDRVNDERNRKQITSDELTALFKKTYEKHGKRIPKLGPDAEAVINDMQSDINMPFVLKWDRSAEQLDLVAKTVMRKKNFMTSNQKLTV